ncbi:Unknown protein sequence [Pseudomonas amygdali pv. morsprunorum]|nr:Unknown protein sequence [Pseudomonas amygdali pv. morsprunorum]
MLILGQPRFGDITGLGQTAIKTTDAMAFALDVDIARRVFDALGADIENTEIQGCKNVGFRKVSPVCPPAGDPALREMTLRLIRRACSLICWAS